MSPREKRLLGVLGLAAGALLLLHAGRHASSGGERRPLEPLPPIRRAAPIVHGELLAQGPASYEPDGRNLFDYFRLPPPRPPAQTVLEPPPIVPLQREEPVHERPVVPPASLPSPSFKYVGYLGPKQNRIAVFSEGEQQIYAQVGEVVGDQFELLKFKYETVVFGFVEPKLKGRTTELKMVSGKVPKKGGRG